MTQRDGIGGAGQGSDPGAEKSFFAYGPVWLGVSTLA
jgi:hypothetical protein